MQLKQLMLRLAALVVAMAAVPAAADPGSRTIDGMDLLDVPALRSEKASTSLLLGLAGAGARLVAVGERGIVVYTDDAGKTWSQADVPVSVTLTRVVFPSPRTGWAVGHDGVILKSEDAGLTWRRVIDGNTVNALVIADLTGRVAAFEAGMAADDDEAAEQLDLLKLSLEDAQSGAHFGPTRPLLDVWFDDDTTGYAAGAFGQLLRTRDGGDSWQSLTGRVPNPDNLHFNAISKLAGVGLVVVGERGSLWKSADDGESWTVSDTGYQGHLYGVFSPGGTTLLAYGFAGSLYRSDDGGHSWTARPRVTTKALVGHVDEGGGRFELISRDGHAFPSTDGGASFGAPVRLPLRAVSAAIPWPDGRIAIAGAGGVAVVASPAGRAGP